jgi:prepilin peptidase CpaA
MQAPTLSTTVDSRSFPAPQSNKQFNNLAAISLDFKLPLVHFRSAGFHFSFPMHSIAWWPTLAALIIATASDLRSRRIPNWLVFPFLLAGLVVSAVIHGWRGLGQSVLGVLLAASLLGVCYWLGAMGMGDLKLCAAIGAWIGPGQLLTALVMTGLVGGVMAFLWAIRGGFLKEALTGASDLVFGLRKRGLRPHPSLVLTNPQARKMPYAPAIAIGTIFSFLALP